jgi:branched-chain amino acid transport system permease protein
MNSTRPAFWRTRHKLIILVVLIAILAVVSVGTFLIFLLKPAIPPYVFDSIVYASLFGLMAIGLTLTYITTKVPNFAYGSFVTIGIYTSFSLFRLNHVSPYLSAPIAFLLGSLSSVVMYLAILRVLARRGSSLVALMISTLAIDIAFVGIFGIYTDYLSSHYRIIDSKFFARFGTDFELFGSAGLVYVAPISLALITVALFLLLTKTRFGIAMRASVENPSLARVLGIDVERTYIFAWFLAGGFAATAGSYYTLWLPGGTTAGSNLIVEIFAASVLGGLASIYGAAIGGVLIGASEILLTQVGVEFLGGWVLIFQKGVPLLIMGMTLLVFPRGLVSVNWLRMLRLFARALGFVLHLLAQGFGFLASKFRRLFDLVEAK